MLAVWCLVQQVGAGCGRTYMAICTDGNTELQWVHWKMLLLGSDAETAPKHGEMLDKQ